MAFATKTPIYQIPYGATGEIETGADDLAQANAIEWPLSLVHKALALGGLDGTLTGLTVSAGTSLAINVSAGAACIGGLVIYAAGVTAKSGLPDNSTLYIYLKKTAATRLDRSFTVEASLSAPPMADAICIATVTTAGGVVIAVGNIPAARTPILPAASSLRLGAVTPPYVPAHLDITTDLMSIHRITNYHASTHSYLMLQRARGTRAAPTAVQSGDSLGVLHWWGHDGTEFGQHNNSGFNPSVDITGVAAENWDATHHGAYLQFEGVRVGGHIDQEAWFQMIERQLRGQAGTVALPTYSFLSTYDTGIYSPADHQIGFTTGGVELLRADLATGLITNAGNPGSALLLGQDGIPGTTIWSIGRGAANEMTFTNFASRFAFAGDIELASSKVFKVNAIQVVGAQGAHVADATTDTTVLRDTVNAILARLETHGLLASA